MKSYRKHELPDRFNPTIFQCFFLKRDTYTSNSVHESQGNGFFEIKKENLWMKQIKFLEKNCLKFDMRPHDIHDWCHKCV